MGEYVGGDDATAYTKQAHMQINKVNLKNARI